MATPHATCSASLRVRRAKPPRLAVLLFVLENKTLIHPTSELLKTNDLDIEVGALVSCRLFITFKFIQFKSTRSPNTVDILY